MKKVMIGFSALFGVLALLMFNIGKGGRRMKGWSMLLNRNPLTKGQHLKQESDQTLYNKEHRREKKHPTQIQRRVKT
jgi:hypothetical protein